MDGHVQTGLTGFLDQPIERLRLELRLITCQIHTDQSIVKVFHRQPRDLLCQLRAFMSIDRSDQAHNHAVLL